MKAIFLSVKTLTVQGKSSIIAAFVILLLAGCTHPDRTYFTIDPGDRKIVIPVQLNDSIEAHLAFDTGAWLGTLDLDSSFCATHSSLTYRKQLYQKVGSGGSAWAENHARKLLYYNVDCGIKIGNDTLKYNELTVLDWKGHMGTSSSEGLFNIPENDTTHVWELNFESNYVEIHAADKFKMPSDCLVFPLLQLKEFPVPFYIKMPIKVKCANGDTLTIEHTYLIDTGMPWDIALLHKDKEFDFFAEQKNAVWTTDLSHYHRYCTVDATLFNDIRLDSLRIYTVGFPNGVPVDYLIGLNFLKRFNVYFDMKRNRVGLQPIKHFQRIINPIHQRFHFSYERTLQGRWLVTCVGNYATNRFKIAGLREGDEIVRINNRLPKDITWLEHRKLEVESDSIVYDIIRGKDNKRIVVLIDKNEKQGD